MRKLFTMILCLFLFTLSGCSSASYSAEGAENYDKDSIVQAYPYHGDLGSNLSIFPDELTVNNDDASYEAVLHTAFFDTDARVILRCKYEPEQMEKEISRLKNLSMTIKNKNEQYTNQARYDTEAYRFPAYITIDGFGNTYEYALIDSINSTIIYIYLAYPNPDDFPYREYLKKDLTAYVEENTENAYSMYHHSFNNGKSWVEFDD